MHEISRFSKHDNRVKMLNMMIRERKLNLDWFDLEDYHDLRPQFVIMINPYDKYVLCVSDAEYYREETGETFFEMSRELYLIHGSKQLELVCEY